MAPRIELQVGAFVITGLISALARPAVAQDIELVVSPLDTTQLRVRVTKPTISETPKKCTLLVGTGLLNPAIPTVAGSLYVGGTVLPFAMPMFSGGVGSPTATVVSKDIDLAPPSPALVGTALSMQALIGSSTLTTPATWTLGAPDLGERPSLSVFPTGPNGSASGSIGFIRSGDVNGDGAVDLAFHKRSSFAQATSQSYVIVALGPDFSQQLEFGSPTPFTNADFGNPFLLADLDGDGDDEVIASEIDSPIDGFARLYVFAGGPNPSTAPTTTFKTTFQGLAGHYGSLAAGDLDGDGSLELVAGRGRAYVGAMSEAGRIDIFRGVPLQPIATIPHPSPVPEDRFGESVHVGDVNGDGLDDIVESSTFADVNGVQNAGRAHVFYGPSLLLAGTIDPPPSPFVSGTITRFGFPVAFLDLDGVGGDEIVISHLSGTKAWIYSGTTLELRTTIEPPIYAGISKTLFRSNNFSTVDLNADGHEDLVLGDYSATNSFDTCSSSGSDGMLLVAYGPFFRTFRPLFDPQGECSAQFAISFVSNDFDGDGDSDLAAVVGYAQSGTVNTGRIEVFFDR